MHVVVSGGTGFIGKHLVKHLLGRGHSVSVISRSPQQVAGMFDGKAAGCTLETLPAAFDGVINLAGATLDKRWTAARKREIVDSRVELTRALSEAAASRGARAFVSGSAIGYYGERGDQPCTEDTAPGSDFLAEVCVKWEQAAMRDDLRVALIRTGLVVHRSGGALAVMLPLFKWLLGGRLGSGRQYWSWIHVDDIVALLTFALENEVSGPLNGAAPNPVTNREFTRALAKAVHRPVSLPVPEFALRLLYGEMADMLLHGQKVLPERTQSLGFQFKYTELDKALHAALYE